MDAKWSAVGAPPARQAGAARAGSVNRGNPSHYEDVTSIGESGRCGAVARRQGHSVADRLRRTGTRSRIRARAARSTAQSGVGVTFVCGARPVRILVIDHGAEGAALAKLLEPWFGVVLQQPASAPSEDLSVFEGVVLGAHGRLEDRVEHCHRLRGEGYAGAILAICADVSEGDALLDAGSDDFATSPFEARELVTRVRASARRAAAHSILRWAPWSSTAYTARFDSTVEASG